MQVTNINSKVNLPLISQRKLEPAIKNLSLLNHKPVFQSSKTSKNPLSMLVLTISSLLVSTAFFHKDTKAFPADWNLEQKTQQVDQRTDGEKRVSMVENACAALLLKLMSTTMASLLKEVSPLVESFNKPSPEEKADFKSLLKKLEIQDELMNKTDVTLKGIAKLGNKAPSEDQAKALKEYVDIVLKGFKMVNKFKEEVPRDKVLKYINSSLPFMPDIVVILDKLDSAIARNNGEFKSSWGIDWNTFGGFLAEEDQ